jgi:hydrogenase nickel incorporation protein HypA/HybF
MHELSIAQALVEELLRAADTSAPGRRIVEVELEIGELSGVVPAVLREVFPMAAEGTRACLARLKIKRVRARLDCPGCGTSFRPAPGGICPRCGAVGATVGRGRELRLIGIEVEDAAPGGGGGGGES